MKVHQRNKSVIVLDNDQQVLKGLVLLLEGMQFTVISARHQDDLKNIKSSQADYPSLLLLPFEFDKGHSGIELVAQLRASFKHCVPAILLSHESGFSTDRFIDDDIVVLSDRINPKDLRRNISTMLTNRLAV